MSRTEETNNAACPITATETLGLHSAFLLTHVDQSANMKMPASLSSDLYRHRIGTRYFLRRNPHNGCGVTIQPRFLKCVRVVTRPPLPADHARNHARSASMGLGRLLLVGAAEGT